MSPATTPTPAPGRKDDLHAALRALPTREEVHDLFARLELRMDRMDGNFRVVIAIFGAIFGAVVAQFFRGG